MVLWVQDLASKKVEDPEVRSELTGFLVLLANIYDCYTSSIVCTLRFSYGSYTYKLPVFSYICLQFSACFLVIIQLLVSCILYICCLLCLLFCSPSLQLPVSYIRTLQLALVKFNC
jgi:hypothetical protein